MTNQTKTILGVIVLIIVIVIIVNWNKWFGNKNGTTTDTNNASSGSGRFNDTPCETHNYLGISPVNNNTVYRTSVYSNNCKSINMDGVSSSVQLLVSKNPPSNPSAYIQKIIDTFNFNNKGNAILRIEQKSIC